MKINVPTLPPNLEYLTKPELIFWCKAMGESPVGSKDILLGRLTILSGCVPISKTQKGRRNVAKKDSVGRKRGGGSSVRYLIEGKESISNIVDMLKKKSPVIHVKRNKYGNFEHHDTKFVFGKNERKVIGKQGDGKQLKPLSVEDIEKCKQLRFEYVLPTNLNIGKKNELSKTLKEEMKNGCADEDENIEGHSEDLSEEEEEEDDDDNLFM
jgi:hypothetical protein